MTRSLSLPLRTFDAARLVRAAVVVGASVLTATLIALAGTRSLIPGFAGLLLASAIVVATPPAWCFAFYVFAAMLFEQFYIVGLDAPVTLQVPAFLNLNLSLGIPGGVVNPVEIMLALMALSWALKMVATRCRDLQAVPHLWAGLLFLGALAFYTAFGLARGGDFKTALWEIRAPYYLCLTYILGSQLIRTRKQVLLVVWALVLGVAIKGMQGMWRYFVTLGGDLDGIPAITGHEDAGFMVTIFVLLAALILLKGPRSLIWFNLITLPSTFFTFLLAQRRVAYGALAFGAFILFFYLPRPTKRMVLTRIAPPLLVLMGAYTGAFWNSYSGAAMPVRQVKSIFMADESGEEDRSNLYREIEKYNLVHTIRSFPNGVGFGRKYLIVIPLDEVDFPLWEFIPHNCILWLWVKMGLLGFWVFWIFVGLQVVQATVDYRFTRDPLFRSLQVMTVIFIVNQLVVSYYDLQLTYYRNMMYLGAMLALMVPIRRLGGAEAAQRLPQGKVA